MDVKYSDTLNDIDKETLYAGQHGKNTLIKNITKPKHFIELMDDNIVRINKYLEVQGLLQNPNILSSSSSLPLSISIPPTASNQLASTTTVSQPSSPIASSQPSSPTASSISRQFTADEQYLDNTLDKLIESYILDYCITVLLDSSSVDSNETDDIYNDIIGSYDPSIVTTDILYKAYIDLEKAIGAIDVDAVVKIIKTLGIEFTDSNGDDDNKLYIDEADSLITVMNDGIRQAISNRPVTGPMTGLGFKNRRFSGRGLMKYNIARTRRLIYY
jgi:hypothetical protein